MCPESPLEEVPGGLLGEPNMRTDQPLMCFINATRICGASCMAYGTFVPNHPDYKDAQWAHCQLLVQAHRVGKHVVSIASVLDRVLKAGAVAEQRKTPPPKVV